MPPPLPAIVRDHPEYSPVFDWHGWAPKTNYWRRLLVAEIVWALRHKGTVRDGRNANEALRDRIVKMGGIAADKKRLSKIGLAMTIREMEEPEPGKPGPFVRRQMHPGGRITKAISLIPEADLPPDPYELTEKRLAREEAVAAQAEARRIRRDEDTGRLDPIARVKAISAAEREEEAARDELRAEREQRGRVTAAVSNGHVERSAPVASVPAVVAPAPAPAPALVAAPEPALVAALVPDDASLAEKALAMMKLAGEVYTECLIRGAVQPVQVVEAEPVEQPEGYDEVVKRLGATMEQVQLLQKRIRDRGLDVEKANASARAAEAALSGERKRREMAEENLAAIAKGDRVPNESGFRVLRSTMQEKPKENPRIPVSM